MNFLELIKQISTERYKNLSNRLLDALLETKSGDKISSSLSRDILYMSMREELLKEKGLVILFEALSAAEPQRAVEILEEFGVEGVNLT